MAKKGKSTSGFITNFTRSTKSLAKDTAKDLMPNLSNTISNNARFIKTTYQDTSIKFKETDLKESFLFKSGNDLIKNAMSDIRTGNFHNKERQQKNTADPFAKLLNFDFDSEDDLSDMFADDKSAPEDTSSDLSNMSLDLDAETKTDIKTLANFSKANTKITNSGFAALNTQLRSISTFQNKNTLKFYELVEEKLNSLDNHLAISSAYYKDLVENTKRSQREVKSNSLEHAFDNMKGFNIEDYVDIYKENFKGIFEVGNMVGSMAIKPIITDIVNNPLGALGKFGMKKLIPKGVRNSLKDIDKTIGMLPVLLQGRIPAMKKKGGIWELLGNILDLDKHKVKAKKNEFVKGPVPFDGVTKRAITHVIPGYLKRILFALTGNPKDNVVYDMESGKFIQEKQVRNNYKDRLDHSRRSAIEGNIDSFEKEYVKALKAKKIIKDDSEAAEYLEELRGSLSNISKSGKTLSSDLKASDFSKDKKTAKIIKEVIDGLNTNNFNEVNKALANAHVQYQQTLRAFSEEDLWGSAYDTGTIGKFKRPSPTNPLFNDTEKLNSKKVKNYFFDKIKNEKIKKGFAWVTKDNEDGRNETLDQFSERILGNFRGDISFDKADFKKKKPRNKSVDSTFKTTVDSIIGGAKSGINFANTGLMQYMTNTPEGLALRVKIADGTIVTTKDSPNDSTTIERNIKAEEEVREKINKKKNKPKLIDLNRYRKEKGQAKPKEDQLLLTNDYDPTGKELMILDNNGILPEDTDYNVFGKIFNDITGADPTKEGVRDLVLSQARGLVASNKYLPAVMKYAPMLYGGAKEYNKKKGTRWDRFKQSSLGQGLKKLYEGSKIFGGKGKNKGLKAFSIFSDLGDFAKRAGFLATTKGFGKNMLNLAGDTLGGFAGGLGSFLSGEVGAKDSLKNLVKGSFKAVKGVKGNAFGFMKNMKKGFKKAGGFAEIKSIIKAKRNVVKPTGDPGTDLVLASNNMTVSVSNAAKVMDASTVMLSSNVEQMTETMEDLKDAIEVDYKVINDEETGLVESILTEAAGETIGSKALSVLGKGKKGKGKFFSKFGRLFGKGKGLRSIGKLFAGVKGLGFLGKLGGMTSGLGGLASGAAAGLGGLASGAVSGLGGLLAGGGSALAGLAGPLLGMLSPFAGPALAAFGISKVFGGIRKRRKAKKEAERAQFYDENGNYKLDAEGYKAEKQGFFPRLFGHFGGQTKLKKIDKMYAAAPMAAIANNNMNAENADTNIDPKELRFDENGYPILPRRKNRGLLHYAGKGLGFIGGKALKGAKYIGSNALNIIGTDYRRRDLTNTSSLKEDAKFLGGKAGQGVGFLGGQALKGAGYIGANAFNIIGTDYRRRGLTNPSSLKGDARFFGGRALEKGKEVGGYAVAKGREWVSNTATKIGSKFKSWSQYVTTPTFGNIFGGNGLFGIMFKGLKKAAGGGGVGRLTDFFKNFWLNASNPGGGTGDGTAQLGGINGEAMTGDNYLGMYTHKFEGDVDTISSGKGDPGGPSYGIAQFPSSNRTPEKFVAWMKKTPKYKDLGEKFGNSKQLTTQFNNIWKDIAKTDRDRFRQAQLEYTYNQDLSVFLKADKSGVDWNRSRALQEMAYSLSTIGPLAMKGAVERARLNNSMSDEQIITKLYDQYDKDANSIIWRSASKSVQESGRQRMRKEKPIILEIARSGRAPIDWKNDGSIKGAESSGSGSFSQPVPGHTKISSPFGKRLHPIQKVYKMHNGIDLPAPTGTKIVASDSGKVTFAGRQGSYGNLLKIDHGNGYETRYAHCNSLDVKQGTSVRKGQAIAKVGSTGGSTGPHLHFEIRKNGSPINPTSQLSKTTSGGGPKGGPIEPSTATVNRTDMSGVTSIINQVTKAISKYNIVVDPNFDEAQMLNKNTKSSYSVNNRETFRDEARNSLILKIKDTLETISTNTGKTNEILSSILQQLIDSANVDSPLAINNELAALYRGL